MTSKSRERTSSNAVRKPTAQPNGSSTRPSSAETADRAQRLVQTEVSFIHSAEFEEDGAERTIVVAGQSESSLRVGRRKAPSDVPAHLAHLWEVALLKPDEEQQLFRRMNYQKYRANILRSRLNPARPNVRVMDQIEKRLTDARLIRNHFIQANMRLVVSIARRFVSDVTSLDELISDGNLILIKAVDRFEYSRGFRFSTYATHALQREFYRTYKNTRLRRITEVVTAPNVLFQSVEASQNGNELLRAAEAVDQLKKLMSIHLDGRENQIVGLRFGLDSPDGGQTLREIGEKLNISKERVRQLQTRAIEQIREVATFHIADG